MGTYRGASLRCEALTWGAEDLSAEIAAEANRYADGRYIEPYQLARSLCLFAAVASEVTPIDTVFTNYKDGEGHGGFQGRDARHAARQICRARARARQSREAALKHQRASPTFCESMIF